MNRSTLKGAVAGLVGGMAASWVMNQFQALIAKGSGESSGQQGGGDDATMKAAELVSETVSDRHLSKEDKQTAGPVVHYLFGSSIGALYGALTEVAPQVGAASGLAFGAAVWLGADEIGVPALGLSKSPFEYPASTHASALASHLVYGLTTDLVRRAVRVAVR
jgi:putative membrane protein